MRTIKGIVIHCTATVRDREYSISTIEEWHKHEGFAGIGYHYVIHLDGAISKGRDLSKPGAHCKGQNLQTIGICYVGGLDYDHTFKDTRTPEQKKAMKRLVLGLAYRFKVEWIAGHNQFSNKACPCFDVKAEYSGLL